MPLYAYKAVASNGTCYTGYRFAGAIQEIYQSLKIEGLLLVNCHETDAERFLSRLTSKFSTNLFQRIPQALLIDFCHDMALLDEAGVSVDNALNDIALSTPHHGFRKLLHMIHDDVSMGVPLSEALGRYPKVFDREFQVLIGAAEKAGHYAPQFRHLGNHLQRLEAISHQLQKAIRSPLILLGLMTILLLVVIDFMIPNLTTLMASLGLQDLPISTRLLLYVAPIMAYIPLIMCIFASILGVCYAHPKTRYYLSRIVLSIPLYRPIALSHFWHIFGVMVSGGVELLPSLSQAIQVIRNPYLKDQLRSLADDISAGSAISEAFSETKGLFSPLMVRLIKLSEQTGRLKELVPQAASHHHTLTMRKLDMIVSWLEPSLILMMGALMVWVVLAVIVPFYGMIGNLT